MEQMTGIEPAYSAWEADTLPLSYICNIDAFFSTNIIIHFLPFVKSMCSNFFRVPSTFSASRVGFSFQYVHNLPYVDLMKIVGWVMCEQGCV